MEARRRPAAPATVRGRRLGLTAPPAGPALGALRRAVLGFARDGLRRFPWRATRDPWSVMVSEVMLQQTQAVRVIGPYAAFVEQFPTPEACAAAGAGAVLRAWAGLGYNRRAAMLQRAARVIVDEHGGRVPSEQGDLEALPGIGAYTARAVLAFAYGRRVGVVDVNVGRVLARAVAGAPLSRSAAQALADGLVPAQRSWEWNQAMIELGARLCTARAPACDRCPLARRCAWRSAGAPEPDPARARARPTPFEGSDRQGRGRLVDALRAGRVGAGALAAACGWPGDPDRARRIAADLVAEGMARRSRSGALELG